MVEIEEVQIEEEKTKTSEEKEVDSKTAPPQTTEVKVDETKEDNEEKEEEEMKVAEEKEEEEETKMTEEEEKEKDMQKALDAIMIELDQIEEKGKDAFQNKKYHYAYTEFKNGLRALSDLVLKARDEELKQTYEMRRRKFAINAAAACIKIGHYEQGLEACNLVLENPSDEQQRQKAIYRAGVCCRGLGDLDSANKFLRKLLEEPDLDKLVKRDVLKQLQGIAEENKRYKAFSKGMMSGKASSDDESEESEKKVKTLEELKKEEEVEEQRRKYQADQKSIDESRGAERAAISFPQIMISSNDCLDALNTLAERYADPSVQEQLKEATYDHEFKMGKGFIIRSRKILCPLQRDVLEKYGFLKLDDIDTSSKEEYADAHADALRKFQHTVRYLGQKHEEIEKKAMLCQRLAFGECMADGS